MADSKTTKRALASALKELMLEIPFAKISISDICGRCGMNRKSFYYHFKDKYDLLNWIFDTEFMKVAGEKDYTDDGTEFILDLCRYFEENKHFYSKVLRIEGQNSFKEHFRKVMRPLLKEGTKFIMQKPDGKEYQIDFLADGLHSAMERWILDKEGVPAEKFVEQIVECIFWKE